MKESDLMRKIMVELSRRGHGVHRAQVGLFYTADGRPVQIGDKYHSDLYGDRYPDGKAFYLEVKTDHGRTTEGQERFLEVKRARGCIAGVVRSADEAINLIETTSEK